MRMPSDVLSKQQCLVLSDIKKYWKPKEFKDREDQEFPEVKPTFQKQYTTAMSRNKRETIMEKV